MKVAPNCNSTSTTTNIFMRKEYVSLIELIIAAYVSSCYIDGQFSQGVGMWRDSGRGKKAGE